MVFLHLNRGTFFKETTLRALRKKRFQLPLPSAIISKPLKPLPHTEKKDSDEERKAAILAGLAKRAVS
jgi:hypothetical protein